MTATESMTLQADKVSVALPYSNSESILPTRNYADAELSLRPLVKIMSEATIEIGTVENPLVGIKSTPDVDQSFAELNDNLQFMEKLEPYELAILNEYALQSVADEVSLDNFVPEGSIVVTPFFIAYRKNGELSFALNKGFQRDATGNWKPDYLKPIKLDTALGKSVGSLSGAGSGTKQGKKKFPWGFPALLAVGGILLAVFATRGTQSANVSKINSGVAKGEAPYSDSTGVPVDETHTTIVTPTATPSYTPMDSLMPDLTPTIDPPYPEDTPTPVQEIASFPLSNGENYTMNSYGADQGNSAMDEVINLEGCKTNIDRFDQVNPEFDTVFNQVLMQIPGLGRNEISYVNYIDQNTGNKYRMIVYEINNSADGQPQTVIVYLNRNNEVKTVLIRDKFNNVYESIKGYSRDGNVVNPYIVIIK